MQGSLDDWELPEPGEVLEPGELREAGELPESPVLSPELRSCTESAVLSPKSEEEEAFRRFDTEEMWPTEATYGYDTVPASYGYDLGALPRPAGRCSEQDAARRWRETGVVEVSNLDEERCVELPAAWAAAARSWKSFAQAA
jgi:hypothetical protein